MTFETMTGERVFKLRGQGDEVLREYTVNGWGTAGGGSQGEGWVHVKDFLYGPEGIFATRERNGDQTYLHKDHLGTPRALSDANGTLIGRHDYYAFGSEVPRSGQADEPTKKYTGHERDPHGLADYMLGRTYLYPFMRFATPDVARDGWNLYGYTGGNPVNRVDPDGNYTVSCSNGDQSCEDSAARFEAARQANLKRSGDVGATSLAYGEPGEANGVVITFGPSEPGAAANVTARIDYDQDSGFALVVLVTINPADSGLILESNVGHEGQHVADAQAFYSTVESDGSYDISKNLTTREREPKAYRITHSILTTANTPKQFSGPRGRKVTLGRRDMSAREVEKSIGQILSGTLYTGKLDQRQIPGFDGS